MKLMKTNFLNLTAVIGLAMAVMSACDKNVPDADNQQAERKEPLVMTFEDFITPSDVQIISSDTTSISVSAAYAEKMGMMDFNDRAVTIWRTIGTVPFVRIITDSKVEKGEIILTTVKGEFSDMFENLDMTLDTDLYVNRDYVPTRTTRSGTSEEVTDISGKYMDSDGVYHPAVIIFEEDSPAVKGLQTKSGEARTYFTAEELLEDNYSFDIIDVHTDFKLDYEYPKTDEDNGVEDTDTKIHIKGKVGVLAKLSSYVNVSVGWFKLKKFEVGIKGETELSAKMSFGIAKGIEYEQEHKLADLGSVTSVFWVGIIPVPYTVETSIKEKVEASAEASLALYTSAKYQLGFEKGCIYTSSNGWENTSKESYSKGSFNLDGIKGTAEVEASAGVFYEVAVLLGGSSGPTFSFGPKLSAEAEVHAEVNLDHFEVGASVGAYFGLSGEVGTKVTILGYQLAKWTAGFDLFKLTLFEGSITKQYTDEGWNKLETEWMSSLEKDSHEWEFGEQSKSVSVPYRLPDSEMNF
jgi:hypothetical protein